MKNKLKVLKSILLSGIKKLPFKLTFSITYLCNSKCKICSIWKLYPNQPNLAKDELTLEEITKIFRNLPSTISWISLSGGETFLRRDLSEIVKIAVREVPSLAIISIPTNGLLTGHILKFLEETKTVKDTIIFITFSLDGPPGIHDNIRGIEGAYEKTLNTYKEAKKLVKDRKNFYVGLETTISTLNLDYLPSFFEEVASKGEHLTVTLAHDTGYQYHLGGENENVSPRGKSREVRDIIKAVKKFKNNFKPENLLNLLYINKIPRYLENPENHVMHCSALKGSFFLSPFGKLTPCYLWNFDLGNIREHDYSIIEPWNSTKAREALEIIRNQQCPNCWTPCEAYPSMMRNFFRLNNKQGE